MDSSRTVGNGFTCQEKLSSSKLTSVLEAVAGEYALVINGHSLVSVTILSLSGILPESPFLNTAFGLFFFSFPMTSEGVVIVKGQGGAETTRCSLGKLCLFQVFLCSRPMHWRQTWSWNSWKQHVPAKLSSAAG